MLRGLEYLRRADVTPDERVAEAIELLASKRDGDGRWPLETQYSGRMPVETDEGEGRPSRWNTLRALRVLDWYSAPRLSADAAGMGNDDEAELARSAALAIRGRRAHGSCDKPLPKMNTGSEIRALLEKTADVTRGKDIDALMRNHAPNVLAFDVIFRVVYTSSTQNNRLRIQKTPDHTFEISRTFPPQ